MLIKGHNFVVIRREMYCYKLTAIINVKVIVWFVRMYGRIIHELYITVSIHCAPEMSEIDCIGRIESFWPKFVRGW